MRDARAAAPKMLGVGTAPAAAAEAAAVDGDDEGGASDSAAHADAAAAVLSAQGLEDASSPKLVPSLEARFANVRLPSAELGQAGPRSADEAHCLDMRN
jgi:hypothetical protein